MNRSKEIKKKQSLRNNEYYRMQEIFDKLYKQSKENAHFEHLVEIISSEDNIRLAYRNIKTNSGKDTPGVDQVTIKNFEDIEVNELITIIQSELSNYNPGKVRRVEIPKHDGKTRPLGIPCMKDRIVQQCILQILDPICEAKFYNHSYGFRPNRSTKHAIARFKFLVNKAKLHYVVDIDIKGFFDNIDHAKLFKQLWTIGIRDKNLLMILKKALTAEIKGKGIPEKGSPQGGIISPLLANVVLNELDWWISDQWNTFKSKHNYTRNSSKYKALRTSNLKEMFLIRYADDFKILCRGSKTAFKILNAVKSFLKIRLKLDINPEKSKVTNLRKRYTVFLGLELKVKAKRKAKSSKPKFVCTSHISDKAMKAIYEKLLKQIKKIQKHPVASEVALLNSIILGIQNYYNIASNISKDLGRIDFNLNKVINKRLKPKKKGEHSSSYQKLYAKYCKRKVMKVAEVDIFPIYGVTMEIPHNFSQTTCNYTAEGRELIHKQVPGFEHLVMHVLRTSLNEAVKFSDNRISLIYGQLGKCAITGLNLSTDSMHCHHKKPKSMGGTDDYNNLVYVEDSVHRLIHATSMKKYNELWEKIVIKIKLNTKKELKSVLNKVNHYRKLAGNSELILKQGSSITF